MVHIDVFIVGPKQKNSDFLINLFDGDMFKVSQLDDGLSRNELFIKCLEITRDSDNPMLIIGSDSITRISKFDLTALMSYIMGHDKCYDMFYLCRWKDDCKKLTNITSIDVLGIDIARTYSPGGIQAVYISVEGRNILLGLKEMTDSKLFKIENDSMEGSLLKNLKNGNILAKCTLNNIFDYDLAIASNNLDFNKTSLCKRIKAKQKKSSGSNNLNYFWFILVIIIVILVTFAIIRIGR